MKSILCILDYGTVAKKGICGIFGDTQACY